MRRLLSGWLGASLFSVGLLVVSLSAFSQVALWDASAARAEDGGGEAASAAGEKSGSQGSAETGSAPSQKSMLAWLYGSLGLRYVIIFLFITFNLVALFAMNILALRRDSIVPEELVQEFDNLLNQKQYQEAYDRAKGDDSFLGRVLAAGMAKLSSGYEAAMGAMQEVGEEENLKMEQRLGYVSLIAQVGPMFGLLGTVDGMVMAFNVIAQKNTTPPPSELAQGIGTALVTTVVGLWIAIPAIVYHHIMRNRLVKLVAQAGVFSEDLMKRFAGAPSQAKKA